MSSSLQNEWMNHYALNTKNIGLIQKTVHLKCHSDEHSSIVRWNQIVYFLQLTIKIQNCVVFLFYNDQIDTAVQHSPAASLLKCFLSD